MRRAFALGLALVVIDCGAASNKAPIVPAAVADVADEQRLSTIRVEARLDTEVKDAYTEAITLAELPDDLAAGVDSVSQGSGFFVKAQGALFAITNHHVVSGSQKVKLRFDEHTVIEDAEVIYVDNHFDVAIIAVPNGLAQSLAHTVALSNKPAASAEPVEASGWPGVGDVLSYRLTTGAISDPNFVVPGESKQDTFIQHTAVIDPGNSGGPLFRKKTLEVLGINTLSFTDNHDLYVAVPSASVQTVLDRAMSAQKMARDPVLRRKELVSTCRALVQEISNTGDSPKETIDILSDMISGPLGVAGWASRHVKRGRSHLDRESGETVKGKPHVDADAAKEFKQEADDGDVLEYLRPYALNGLYEDGRQLGAPKADSCEQNMVQKDLDDLSERGTVRCRLDFASSKSFRTLKWRLEQGHWRLIAFDAP